MIVTGCPHCGRTFRVTSEQLRLRQGKVRCGRCRGVFNALESLNYRPDSQRPQKASHEHITTASPTAGILPEEVANNTPPISSSIEEYVVATTPQASNASSPATQAIVSASESISDIPDDSISPPAEESPASIAATIESVAQTLEIDDTLGPPTVIEVASPEESAHFGILGPAPPTPEPKRFVAVLWILAFLCSAIVLAAQTTYFYRTELAVLVPSARLWLEQACSYLSCTVPLPERAQLVAIEASDLHPDPQHKGLLVLQATIRNRATFTQQYPYLEITLTDTTDHALARRAFAPHEYISKQTKVETGFLANTETAIKLWIDASTIAASGYRIYVFYP